VVDLEVEAGKSKELAPRRALCRGLLRLAESLRSAGRAEEAGKIERRGLSLIEEGLAAPFEMDAQGRSKGFSRARIRQAEDLAFDPQGRKNPYVQWAPPAGNRTFVNWWGRAYDLFFLAKAYWRLGEKKKARECYDKAVQWKDKHNPQDPALLPIHLETAALLGVKELGRLDDRLSAVLEGKAQPKDAAERLVFAQLCQLNRKRYAAAERFYEEFFAAQPALADDLSSGRRYNAACAAALAGCGQGQDATDLDDKERARLRKQALDWLHVDLGAWRRLLEKGPDKARPAVAKTMQHWLADPDFAGVRGDAALAKLPEVEHPPWQKLWAEVESLRSNAAGPARPPADSKPQGKEGPPKKP
jgi:hypothetical protein